MAKAKKTKTTKKQDTTIVPVDVELEYKLSDTTADSYIKINDEKITELLNRNAEQMYTLTGEIDTNSLITSDLLELNLLSLYDIETNEVLDYNFNDVKKGSDYWEQKTDEYIETLKATLEQDITNVEMDELKELIVKQNKGFIKEYLTGIKANALDLADEITRIGYARRLANSLTELQAQELNKVDIDTFLNTDLKIKPYKFMYYIEVDKLERVQQSIINLAQEWEKVDDKDKPSVRQHNIVMLSKFLYVNTLGVQRAKVDAIYQDKKDFYDKRHKKREQIHDLVEKIAKKYKDQQQYLEDRAKPRYRALDNDSTDSNNIIEEMQRQDKNLESAKFNTTLLSNKLFTGKDLESGTPYQFTYKERKTKEDITTSITIYDSNSNIIKLSKEHRDINDAVGSLLDNGIRYLTLKQLYNFINKGIISNDPVEQDKLDDLLKDLYNMDRKADIDATEQFKLRGYQEYLQEYEKKTGIKARPIISQNLINFKILKNVPIQNGEIIDIICFMDYPAIYDYARQYRQLAPYPVEILNLNYSPKNSSKDNTIQINDITRTIRNELIRCIELRKSGINQPLVINNFLCNDCQFYDVIDKDTTDKNDIHIKVLNKQKRIRYTKNIETILNNFKDKSYIKGYKINKNGKVNKYSISFILK